MGLLDWLEEVNKQLHEHNKNQNLQLYGHDPNKLTRVNARLDALNKPADPGPDFNKMTDAELEDLRDHTKLEIEELERQLVVFRAGVEQQKQRQNPTTQSGFWASLGQALNDAVANAGIIEAQILEKKKLLASVENRLKKPASPPSKTAQRQVVLDEIDRLTQEMNDQIQKRPHMTRDIKMMYQNLIDDERKKL